jgi:hypothetical protein
VVDMVDQQSIGNLYEFTVHVYPSELAWFWAFGLSCRVETARSFYRKPFVSSQSLVISRVYLSVSGLCQANQAKRVPIAQPPIQKHRRDQYALQPIENVKACFDLPPPLMR